MESYQVTGLRFDFSNFRALFYDDDKHVMMIVWGQKSYLLDFSNIYKNYLETIYEFVIGESSKVCFEHLFTVSWMFCWSLTNDVITKELA
jgi:hypothetical protein